MPYSNSAFKRHLARRVSEMVEDGDAIIMDASSTVRQMIPFLKERRQLTIVTIALETAQLLAQDPAKNVYLNP